AFIFLINPGGTFQGDGWLVVKSQSTLTVNTDVSHKKVRLDGFGTINGPNTLTVTQELDWNDDAFMTGPGSTIIANGANLIFDEAQGWGPGSKNLIARILQIAPQAVVDFKKGGLTVAVSGTINNYGDWRFTDDNSNITTPDTGIFNNYGQVRKTG